MANLDKIPCHYAFTNLPSIFDEEALTALELCGRLAGKVNEIIKAYNNLDDETREKLTAQDKEIAEGLATLTEKLPPYVSDWLLAHPEITTTIQDGEIQLSKLHNDLKNQIVNGYVTPEMYGYSGEGDATDAIQAAINNPEGLPVLLAHDYTIKRTLTASNYKKIIVEKTLYVDGDIIAFYIDGMGSTICGNGVIKTTEAFKNKGTAVYLSCSNIDGVYTFYNNITIGEIRGFSHGIQIINGAEKLGETYFNKIENITFVDCAVGIQLFGYANGNKFGNLTFYNCGIGEYPGSSGAILFNGSEEHGHPIENMFYNISTTNAENCSSICVYYKCCNNNFSGLQFENGGAGAWGFYANVPDNFSNNTICGMIDINNQGSKRGRNNTWIMAFDGKNEMPAIKTREEYRPCGFKYAIKKDSSSDAFADGAVYTIAHIDLPAYQVANINIRAMLVSSAAGDIVTGESANITARAKSDGSFVPCSDGSFNISSDGGIHFTVPNAGVGVPHYTTCLVELDVITTSRDKSKSMTPGHYGITITPYEFAGFKEYKGDW